MHRNTKLSLGLVLMVSLFLLLCSCDSSTGRNLAALQGIWDYTASGTGHISNYYSVGARRVEFSGNFSITPTKVTDRLGYDWEWTYSEDELLHFQMLKAIPIADNTCGVQLIEGMAIFEVPLSYSTTAANGHMFVDNATIRCENSDVEGDIAGVFSVYMHKR
jgi:hypothetical protein